MLRTDIEAMLTKLPEPERKESVLAICLYLDEKLGLSGNGWLDDDQEWEEIRELEHKKRKAESERKAGELKVRTESALGVEVTSSGAIISIVHTSSAAMSAGLCAGDVIRAVNKMDVRSAAEFCEHWDFWQGKPWSGPTTDLEVVRGAEARTTEVTWQDGLGVSLLDGSGALISMVSTDGAGKWAGLRAGDIVRAVNRVVVNSVEQFCEEYDGTVPGQRILLEVVRASRTNTLEFLGLEMTR
jgi:S1-C subfamily serine protease